ncbi:MAG: formylglycine-generating enzyme family protein [Nitrospinales bacterium]
MKQPATHLLASRGFFILIMLCCATTAVSASDRWVTIEAGEFVMGGNYCAEMQSNSDWCADETPHRVRLDRYAIARHEVTNAEYNKCVEAEVCAPNILHDTRPRDFTRPGQPVVFVTWADAEAYCRWIEARLPTEAEWEKAAQSEDLGGAYYGRAYGAGAPQDVGGLPPNSHGLYDMLGNVYEWTRDWYGPYETREIQVNPRGPDSGKEKVVRGGSWNSPPHYLRVQDRLARLPGRRFADLGFRCAKSLP